MMDQFEVEAVRIALRQMFSAGRYFDICCVMDCLKTAGIDPPLREIQALRPLHCVHWSQMSPEMRAETLARTIALFKHPAIDLTLLEVKTLPQQAQRHTLLRRLLA